MPIPHLPPLHHPHHHTALIPPHHPGHLRPQPHLDPPPHQILPPGLIKLPQIRKNHHRRRIRRHAPLLGREPHPVRRTRAQPLQNHARHLRGVVPRPEKQRHHRQRDGRRELVGKAEQLHEEVDGQQREDELEGPDDAQHPREERAFGLVAGEEAGGEDVGPEGGALAEGDVQVDGVGGEALAGEHGEGVVEDGGAALDALVEPGGAVVLLGGEGDGEGLAAAVGRGVDEGDGVAVGVLGEVVGAGHAWWCGRLLESRGGDAFEGGGLRTGCSGSDY